MVVFSIKATFVSSINHILSSVRPAGIYFSAKVTDGFKPSKPCCAASVPQNLPLRMSSVFSATALSGLPPSPFGAEKQTPSRSKQTEKREIKNKVTI